MYILFNCDEWKSHSSMSLMGVFNEEYLRKTLKSGVEKGYYELDSSVSVSNDDIDYIANLIDYAYIIKTELNEILG